MRPRLTRYDDFWALHVNGYIHLFSKDDFFPATKEVKRKYGDSVWSQFVISVGSFARLSENRLHAKIEKDVHYAISNFYHQNPELIPRYRFTGDEARRVASIFIDACLTCPASKNLSTCESIYVDGIEVWVFREYHPKKFFEHILNRKRLAKTATVSTSKIEELVGNSTDFNLKIGGKWMRISHEGVREV